MRSLPTLKMLMIVNVYYMLYKLYIYVDICSYMLYNLMYNLTLGPWLFCCSPQLQHSSEEMGWDISKVNVNGGAGNPSGPQGLPPWPP